MAVGVKPFNPGFSWVRLLPSHFYKNVNIKWKVRYAPVGTTYFVTRRIDSGPWVILNENTPTENSFFVDTDFVIRTRFQKPEYMIIAVLPNGSTLESDVVSLYYQRSNPDYGIVSAMVMQKFTQAMYDGIPVFYYPATRSGPLNEDMDPSTGINTIEPCIDDTDDGSGEGSNVGDYYATAFDPPYLTLIRIMQNRSITVEAATNGTGFEDKISVPEVEFLCWPPVRPFDMIVNPASDDRYLIGKTVLEYNLRGNYPVCYNASINLMQYNQKDIYGVPLPENWKELIANLRRWIPR